MNGLSLFSGAAIGEVVFKQRFPDYRTVGYVEIDRYCRSIIRARIRDGILDDAPIFDDIRTFNTRYARRYTGKVDFISAGFPCQPFSVAGIRACETDERNLWPETRDAVGIIRPHYVFLENVPGLIATQYIWTILADLAKFGYLFESDTFGAGSIGAPYPKHRLWILCSLSSGVRFKGGWARPIGAWPKQQFEGLLRNQIQLAVPAGRRGRVAVRVADRVGRVKAAGNGWVPQVVDAILQVGE